jgi:hypothetical protein
MDAKTTNAAELCVIAIQMIHDFNTRATTSPAAAATTATALAEISQTRKDRLMSRHHSQNTSQARPVIRPSGLPDIEKTVSPTRHL